MQDKLSSSAQYVKGVGPKRYEMLKRLGAKTIEDMLFLFPRRYEDRSNLKPLAKVVAGNVETVQGEVLKMGVFKAKNGKIIFQLEISDGTGMLKATWLNQPYMRNYFKVGDKLILHGRVERWGGLTMLFSEYEIMAEGEDEALHMNRIVPIYPLTKDLAQRTMRAIMKNAVDEYAEYFQEILPDDIRRRNNLLAAKKALRNIHFPDDMEIIPLARRRFIYEELFVFQVAIAMRKWRLKMEPRGIVHKTEGPLVDEFLRSLPFKLTEAQLRAIEEIKRDMGAKRVMSRLLQGDVGSGKTVVAAYAILLALQGGYQAALMAPTEVLAEQHAKTLSALYRPLGVRLALLVGSSDDKLKDALLEDIAAGRADVVIGTHTLIQEHIRFKKLGLVVIDEQHKFGVVQRERLHKKGEGPDVLVMTATPIPRTLAMTLYGDLDISVIDEMPKPRSNVKTLWIQEDKRRSLYESMRRRLKEGAKAFCIYPVIEESAKLDLRAAKKMYEELAEEFSEFKVGLIHGRVSKEERDEIMRGFREGRINILVATTVVEVGLDVPDANIMLIEHAERFGLSQLHQLRGRIGRDGQEAFCILVSDAQGEDARARLDAMVATQDGFKIAEEDLEIRGPGEFFGKVQHGLPELKLADLVKDKDILTAARQDAFNLIKEDPHLIKHKMIIERLLKFVK